LLAATGLKFSFQRTIPKNLKELQEYSQEKDRHIAAQMKLMSDGVDDESLFEEGDSESNYDFETMDPVVDSTESKEIFEDEKLEKDHYNEMLKEQFEIYDKLKKGISTYNLLQN
jgi:hypothetical protein